ncbi:MAG: hypothetical protein RI909_553 [Bacteroidota bacterium]
MTTLKDPVRQTSLFTPFGLIDPRIMPEYVKPKTVDHQAGFRRSGYGIVARLKSSLANFFVWRRSDVRYINLDKINLSKRR